MSRAYDWVQAASSQTEKAAVGYRPSWRVKHVPVDYGTDENAPQKAAVLVSADPWRQAHLSGERFHDVFEQCCTQLGNEVARHLAVDYGERTLTFAELRDRSNQLARFFIAQGVGFGTCIGLLLDRSIDSYAAVLAASKLGATYVPLDTSFPADRIRFMLADSAAKVVITLRHFTHCFSETTVPILALDDNYDEIQSLSSAPFKGKAAVTEFDPVAYIIYTSGSTGRPKGVPIRHASICNFLHIASVLYGYRPSDRVYQGMTIAFDFSFEEVWVPLIAGATLVPAPAQAKLLSDDLKDFLVSRKVTALCCVPTLLATLDADFPQLRFLLVSGEACPADVIAKWLVPGRRVLNAYGPTETTVTATWSLVEPDKPITIGGPLPTYSVVIVDPDTGQVLEPGASGEVCIGGVAVFDGYLNRPEQNERAFIPDRLNLPDNPGGTLYRTGDLGRINAANEIEYLGRIDTQVKIRGYRIELSEIEAVARSVEGVEQAVVQPFDLDGTGTVLSAYLTSTQGGVVLDMAKIDAVLRAALPGYMVPAYYQQLDTIPLLPSTKADRKALPPPTGIRFSAPTTEAIAARTPREQDLAQLLARVLKLGQVSVTANFFNELGADSLTMASYITVIRKELGLRQISMRQLYEYPTVAELATFSETVATVDAIAEATTESLTKRAAERHGVAPHIASDWARWTVGFAQFIIASVELFAIMLATVASYHWVEASTGIIEVYCRATIATNLIFFGTAAAFILLKWIAIGRFSTDPIPIWSLHYLRFWIARRAIQFNPLNLFVGTPLYSVYLRLLGMRVGHNTLILSMPPVCTDLISIGANSVIRQDVAFNGYTAINGYLYPGSITIGSNAVICEATTLDIFTAVGDHAQLGLQSALTEGQSIPAGSVYQGTPAEPSNANFNRVADCPASWSRKALFTTTHFLSHCLVSSLLMTATVLLLRWSHNHGLLVFENVFAFSAISYFGALVLAMLVTLIVPRLLNWLIVPGVAHPLYGMQYELARGMARTSNNKLLNLLFGDSSMILYWLALVGYNLKRCTQTGSNFGVEQIHHSPFLCEFGRNTLVADGLTLLNMEASASSFILRKIVVPPDSYFGNSIHYPGVAQLGANCLIGTKAAIPMDGPVRTNVGLLGSPVFEIPRSVARDHRFDHYKQPDILQQRLGLKLRSNLVTLGLYLLRSWLLLTLGVILTLACLHLFKADLPHVSIITTTLALTVDALAFVVVAALFSIFCERLVCGFRPIEPRYCSLYDAAFWAHERYWKLGYNEALKVFDGTPIKPLFLRLQGAIVGKRLFDDGSGFAEPSMVEIGDDCTFNQGAFIQCHSLEDGTFKSDRVQLGSRCTLAASTFVQYGVTMHDDTVLDVNALLMKGSVMEAKTHWLGNPAREATPLTLHEKGPLPVQATEQLPGFIVAGASLDTLNLCAITLLITGLINAIVFKNSLPGLPYLTLAAFPLLAFALACHLVQTAHLDKTINHLVIMALVSQPIYCLALQDNSLNMLFTLGLGAIIGRWLVLQSGICPALLTLLAATSLFFKMPIAFGLVGIVLPGLIAYALTGHRLAWVSVGILLLLPSLNAVISTTAGILDVTWQLPAHLIAILLATYLVPIAIYLMSRLVSGSGFLKDNQIYLIYVGCLLLLSLYQLWLQPMPVTLLLG